MGVYLFQLYYINTNHYDLYISNHVMYTISNTTRNIYPYIRGHIAPPLSRVDSYAYICACNVCDNLALRRGTVLYPVHIVVISANKRHYMVHPLYKGLYLRICKVPYIRPISAGNMSLYIK